MTPSGWRGETGRCRYCNTVYAIPSRISVIVEQIRRAADQGRPPYEVSEEDMIEVRRITGVF